MASSLAAPSSMASSSAASPSLASEALSSAPSPSLPLSSLRCTQRPSRAWGLPRTPDSVSVLSQLHGSSRQQAPGLRPQLPRPPRPRPVTPSASQAEAGVSLGLPGRGRWLPSQLPPVCSTDSTVAAPGSVLYSTEAPDSKLSDLLCPVPHPALLHPSSRGRGEGPRALSLFPTATEFPASRRSGAESSSTSFPRPPRPRSTAVSSQATIPTLGHPLDDPARGSTQAAPQLLHYGIKSFRRLSEKQTRRYWRERSTTPLS